ncbi:MAG: hypothetical protein ACYCSP_02010 [Acidobacteriaceae bacterium]
MLYSALPSLAQSADASSSAPQVQLPAAFTDKLEVQPPASADAAKYAPRALLLLSGQSGVEAVMPMVFTINGQTHLEFVSGSKIKESIDNGGQPIRLGDVLSALGEATQTINKLQAENAALQAENAKLWKVAMKDAPQQQPPTIVVQQPQQPIPQQPSRFEQYMLLRSLLPASHPYQLPMPVNPNANRIRTNCTANTAGNTTYTNCN